MPRPTSATARCRRRGPDRPSPGPRRRRHRPRGNPRRLPPLPQPDERLIPCEDIVEATPRNEERLGHGIVAEIVRYASAAEVTDRSVVATVDLGEQGRPRARARRCGARPVAHDTSMPDRRCWSRETRVTSAASGACLLRATGIEASDSGPGQPGALAMSAPPPAPRTTSAGRSNRLVVATSAKSGGPDEARPLSTSTPATPPTRPRKWNAWSRSVRYASAGTSTRTIPTSSFSPTRRQPLLRHRHRPRLSSAYWPPAPPGTLKA